MENDERELFDAFGLEVPEAPDGAGAPEETAEPEQDDPPAQSAPGGPEETGSEAGAATAPEEPDGGEAPPSEPQTVRAAPAAKQEPDAQSQTAIDRAYAKAYEGKIDPYTGNPILSEADYRRYERAYRADQQAKRLETLKQAGLDPKVIQDIISEHPVVRQAQEAIRQAEAERGRARAAEAKGWYTDQLQQINTLDPEARVTGLDALEAKDPNGYRSMMDMVKRGMSLVDAYKLSHFDALTQRRAAAAEQRARNQTAGKAHMQPVGGAGSAPEGVEVPGDVRQMYRDMNPGMSDADIRKAYAEYRKEIG